MTELGQRILDVLDGRSTPLLPGLLAQKLGVSGAALGGALRGLRQAGRVLSTPGGWVAAVPPLPPTAGETGEADRPIPGAVVQSRPPPSGGAFAADGRPSTSADPASGNCPECHHHPSGIAGTLDELSPGRHDDAVGQMLVRCYCACHRPSDPPGTRGEAPAAEQRTPVKGLPACDDAADGGVATPETSGPGPGAVVSPVVAGGPAAPSGADLGLIQGTDAGGSAADPYSVVAGLRIAVDPEAGGRAQPEDHPAAEVEAVLASDGVDGDGVRIPAGGRTPAGASDAPPQFALLWLPDPEAPAVYVWLLDVEGRRWVGWVSIDGDHEGWDDCADGVCWGLGRRSSWEVRGVSRSIEDGKRAVEALAWLWAEGPRE